MIIIKAIKPALLVLLIAMIISPYILYAGPIVTAQYFPENSITLEKAVGPFTSSTVLGAKLGTFYVTSSTGKIYSPSLIGIQEASGAITITGLMRNYATDNFVQRTQDFYIISAAYPNGFPGTPVLFVLYNDVRPLVSWDQNTVSVSPFVVELYLVNHNTASINHVVAYRPSSYFSLGTPYALPSGFNPQFSIATAENGTVNVGSYTNGGVVDQTLGSYVTTNSIGGADNTPIMGPGAYTDPDNPGSPGFFYGDVPVVPSFLFNFSTDQASFPLSDAYGGFRVVVTQATLTVVNGVQNVKYKMNLLFSDQSTATSFQLFPLQGGDDAINYSLYLGGELITKNTTFLWKDLVSGPNVKDLSIGGISQSVVSSYVGDTYKGTITVNISIPN